MLQMIAKLLRALNGDTNPAELSLGALLAWWVGMTPGFTLTHVILLTMVLILRCNLSVFLALWPLFKILYLLTESSLEQMGLWLMTNATLHHFWEMWFNTWPGRWMAIDDPRQVAALTVNLSLSVPLFLAMNWAIVRYRTRLMKYVETWHVVRWLKTTRLWRVYQSIGGNL